MSEDIHSIVSGLEIKIDQIREHRLVTQQGHYDGVHFDICVKNCNEKDLQWARITLFKKYKNSYSKCCYADYLPIGFLRKGEECSKKNVFLRLASNIVNGDERLIKLGLHAVSFEFVGSRASQQTVKNVSFGSDVTCFPSGTPVLTPYGDREIETFKKGDLVLSWNQNKQAFYERHVKKLVTHDAVPVIEITLTDDIDPIRVTPSHNLLTSKGWVQAGHLNSDDALFVVNKQNGLLGLSRVLYASRTADILPVHNLIVEGEHNFVAGGVIAHSFTFARGLRSALHTGVEKTKGFLAGGNQPKPAFVFGG